jgi:hypothetical protein
MKEMVIDEAMPLYPPAPISRASRPGDLRPPYREGTEIGARVA